MLLMLRRLIGENIELIWLPAPQPCQVQMDPTQLDQILVNLCVNARDAMTGSGRLTIETQRLTLDATQCADHADVEPGDFVCLSVTDTGHGIPSETLAQSLSPSSPQRRRNRPGLGHRLWHRDAEPRLRFRLE
jgi:signal transduction histidine kinase